MEFSQTNYIDTPQWNQIRFTSKSGNTQVEIGSAGPDGEIEFYITESNESTTFFLNQENIRQLIEHLKTQLK
jgi:hypothetical protein